MTSRHKVRRSSILALSTLSLLAGLACSDADTFRAGEDIFQSIHRRLASSSRAPALYHSLPEAMPNVAYLLDGELTYIDSYFVVGTVESVSTGPSFMWSIRDDIETRTEVSNDDPSAQVTTFHIRVSCESTLRPPTSKPMECDTLTFGLALDPSLSLKAVQASLSGTRVAALLYDDSRVFDYDPNLFAVYEDGSFLGVVDGDEVLFGALDGPEGAGLRLSLTELIKPDSPTPISVESAGGEFIRSP